jgi:hypothetical protein
MTWWLWILFGAALFTAAWFGGLLYADVMMRRGQSSFFRGASPQQKIPVGIASVTEDKYGLSIKGTMYSSSEAQQQKRIEALECEIARLEHIADLADKLVKNAWTDEYAFNPDTYTVFGEDVAQLSAALLQLELEQEASQ